MYVPNTLIYVCVRCVIRREQINFLDMFKIYQRMRAYRIYLTHTLTIRTAYAEYARHTLVRSFSEICIRFLKFANAIHML